MKESLPMNNLVYIEDYKSYAKSITFTDEDILYLRKFETHLGYWGLCDSSDYITTTPNEPSIGDQFHIMKNKEVIFCFNKFDSKVYMSWGFLSNLDTGREERMGHSVKQLVIGTCGFTHGIADDMKIQQLETTERPEFHIVDGNSGESLCTLSHSNVLDIMKQAPFKHTCTEQGRTVLEARPSATWKVVL